MKINSVILNIYLLGSITLMALNLAGQPRSATWTNPLNLNYRFSSNGLGYREAADPVMHVFKGTYYLYASKSGGYWYSDDMLKWIYRPSKLLPTEDYAPAVFTMHDTAFFMASTGARKIYYSTNPKEDNWQVYRKDFPLSETDPDLFLDDDGRVYFYYGCSNEDPIMGLELNPNSNFDTIGTPKPLIRHQYQEYGWEAPGEHNNEEKRGWNEGAWMNKYQGKYYLQYAAPGTEFKGYGDGVYVGDHPLGPFTYMPNSPFSYKPSGFISGAGHGSTFQDKYGNYWHVATMTISVRHMFERRIGLFPAFFDKKGNLHCLTAFGDYPLNMPDHKMNYEKETLFTGWNLLSYHKTVTASSSISGHPPEMAVNEEVRNWWSAASGKKGEWLQLDLQQNALVQALQINFADQGAAIKGGQQIKPYQYQIMCSSDAVHWKVLVDKSKNRVDITHDYIVLPKPVKTKYLKLINFQVPRAKQKDHVDFSISGFRVFGAGNGQSPARVAAVNVRRLAADRRKATLNWKPVKNAVGYVVHYGNERGKLYHSVMIYPDEEKNENATLELTGLNKPASYFFRIDAFNENGITEGKETKEY